MEDLGEIALIDIDAPGEIAVGIPQIRLVETIGRRAAGAALARLEPAGGGIEARECPDAIAETPRWKRRNRSGLSRANLPRQPGHETLPRHARNAGPTCRETVARHAVKSWPGIT